MAAQLVMSERRVGDVTILDLTGRLIADEEDVRFKARIDGLLQASRVNIIVNFQNVTAIDSGGIGALVGKYLSVRRTGGDMRLLNLTARTRRVLDVTRLAGIFTIFDSEQDAVRSFASPAAPAVPADFAAR